MPRSAEKQKFKVFRIALFHMKTRICLIYYFHDCSIPSKKEFLAKSEEIMLKFNVKERLMENSTSGRTWSSGKLFVLKNDTTIADRDVSLTAENLLFL